MPQRNSNTRHMAKCFLASVLTTFVFSQTLSNTVFAVDTELSANTGNYQTIDEHTSLLHTNTEITNSKLIGCNFDITVILNDGELVSNWDEEILEHMSYSAEDNGILTINTDASVILSNAQGYDKINHSIVVEKVADMTFDGIYLERPLNSHKPLLDVRSQTTLIINDFMEYNTFVPVNAFEVFGNGSLEPTVVGIENLLLTGDGSLIIFSNEEDISVYKNLKEMFSSLVVIGYQDTIEPEVNKTFNPQEIGSKLDKIVDEILIEEAFWNTVFATSDISDVNTSDYLPNCDFYVTVDVGNDVLIDNYDEQILAYVSFNENIETGILTIKTSKPVTISNKYGIDKKSEHKIIISHGLDQDGGSGANITLSGVYISSSDFDDLPLLNVQSKTYINVQHFETEDNATASNILEMSVNNAYGKTIEGLENIIEVGGDGLLEIIALENDDSNYSELGENVSHVKITFVNELDEIEMVIGARLDILLATEPVSLSSLKFTELYNSSLVPKDNMDKSDISSEYENVSHFENIPEIDPENDIYSDFDNVDIDDNTDTIDIDTKVADTDTNEEETIFAENHSEETAKSSVNSKYTVIGGSAEAVTNAVVDLSQIDENTEYNNPQVAEEISKMNEINEVQEITETTDIIELINEEVVVDEISAINDEVVVDEIATINEEVVVDEISAINEEVVVDEISAINEEVVVDEISVINAKIDEILEVANLSTAKPVRNHPLLIQELPLDIITKLTKNDHVAQDIPYIDLFKSNNSIYSAKDKDIENAENTEKPENLISRHTANKDSGFTKKATHMTSFFNNNIYLVKSNEEVAVMKNNSKNNATVSFLSNYDVTEINEDTENIIEPVSFLGSNSVVKVPTISTGDVNVQLSSSALSQLILNDFSFIFGKKDKVDDEDFPYMDIDKDNELYEHIVKTHEEGVFVASSDVVFASDSQISRAEIVGIMYNMENSPASKSDNTFTDVNIDDEYFDAIVWATENEIIFGIGNDLFDPDTTITNEQLIAILHRYTNYKKLYDDKNNYDDIVGIRDYNEISNYAVEPIEWAIGNEVIEPTVTNRVLPKRALNRGQVVVIFSDYLDLY